jgi:hypothetical protein
MGRTFQGWIISSAVHGSLLGRKAVVRETDGRAQPQEAKTACWARWRTAAGKKAWKRMEGCWDGSCPNDPDGRRMARRRAWMDGWDARSQAWRAGSPPDG